MGVDVHASDDEGLVVDAARCAHETVDGETMVIDTVTGQLVLLDGLGPALWERLRIGTRRSVLAAEVQERFGAEAGEAARAFVDELVASELVVVGEAPAATGAPEAAWPAAYEPPSIERIDEIADIMSMDPVHDVDAALGWPHAAGDATG